MATRTRAACLLMTTLVALPAAAQAAPKDGSGSSRHRYTAAHVGENVDCQAGATCTVEGSADRSGALASSSRYRRDAASTDQSEAGVGYVSHSAAVPVPAGATAVTVTATWQLDLRAAASAETGTTYGAVYLGMQVPQCAGGTPSCRTTTSTERTVRRVHDTASQLSSSQGTDGIQTITLSVRVEGEDIPQQLSVAPHVGASAGGYPDCALVSLCPAPNHAGTASASFSGTLQSVTVAIAG